MDGKAGSPAIVIVGAGFGGIGLAIALRKAGIRSFTILERAGEVGGVWRENRYPGAACDVASRMYSYSFECDWPWTRKFAPQPEILAYLKHCVAKYDLEPHIRFDTEVAGARFDEASARWRIALAGGEQVEADVFVSAVGLFNRPRYPDIPGRESFAGVQFHSARWNHDYPLDGKTVAVIGTGASAIQFVPAIAPRVGKLHVFYRSPQYVFPRGAAPLPEHPTWWQRHPLAHRLERMRIFASFESRGRQRGSPRMTAEGEARFRAILEAKVRDPELRRKLTPSYPLGCKRTLFSDDWFDALQRPNVEVTDTAVAEILPAGVRTRDGAVRPVDAIVYGTGFTPTDYLTPMHITGLAGRDLNAAWRGGAEAYLGMTVAGFPNFFMMYGPNTNVVGSIVFMLESQARYIVDGVRTLARRGAGTMTVLEAAQRRFNDEIQRRIAATVMVQDTCHSYFRDPTGKVTTNWPGWMTEYRLRTRRVRPADYAFAAAPSVQTSQPATPVVPA